MNSQKLLSKNDVKSFTQANRIAITNVIVTDSSYVELDDTAVSSSGGYLKLIGYGFLPGATIYLNGSPVSNTFISSGEYRVVVPAIAPSTVNLMMFNNNNSGAIYTNGVTTSGFPSFTSTTYLTLGTTISVQLLVTGDAPLTYSLYSGTLPDGSPNLMLLYNLATNKANDKEQAENGKVEIVTAVGPGVGKSL
jgi:hypothetical protein